MDRQQAARRKREHRADRNMRNEYMQGRGPEGLELASDGSWRVECCRCERWFEWPAMACEYSEDDHQYCGGSDRCCP